MKAGFRHYLIYTLIAWFSYACENVSSEEDISNFPDGSYTHTDSNGKITDTDNDDWRIQNYFKNEFYIVQVPFPNPTIEAQIAITIQFSQTFNSLGFYVMGMNTNDFPVELYRSSNVGFGTKTFFLNLSPLSASGSLQDLKGKLFRLRFYDSQNRLMTYGDIKIN